MINLLKIFLVKLVFLFSLEHGLLLIFGDLEDIGPPLTLVFRFNGFQNLLPDDRLKLEGESFFDSTLNGSFRRGHFVASQRFKNPVHAFIRNSVQFQRHKF